MSTKFLTVSPSPHVHQEQSVKELMYGVVIAMVPALLFSIYNFGIGAIYVTSLAIVSCLIFEFAIAKYLLQRKPDVWNGSAIITGILLAFNVPSSLPWYIIVIGSLVAIGIGKMSFGGLGNNPFNPALVGRVFLLISFPVEMTSWPVPGKGFLAIDGTSGATILGNLKEGLANGESMESLMASAPSYTELFWGFQGGSLGEISAFALIFGLVYMIYKKIITWHIPVAMVGSIFIFSGLLWLIDPAQHADPLFHILSGGVMLGAIFMATDYVTSPMTTRGMLVFGVGIGIITVLIRAFGSYPEGVSFAILIMNAFVPLIDKYIKPHRFGAKGFLS
ncbi:MAG: RnfABCDGE type electron transport complex subunit D [Flammeovirgaceae bacterium]|nr:RnfABCDGE type electron transport complex subunit D [Flammeovirgaceae bacterium]